MQTLLRNCAHGSSIATFLDRQPDGSRAILKSASTADGIQDLRREVGGWNWYQQRRFPGREGPICVVERESTSYLRLRLQFLVGATVTCPAGLCINAATVARTIDHYIAVWPAGEVVPVHGDLSIDNIIEMDDGICILDWEHFQLDACPWGFDAVNLLGESLWFAMRERGVPTDEEVDRMREGLARLEAGGPLPAGAVRAPLSWARRFVTESAGRIWGAQLEAFSGKLPMMLFRPDQVEAIDSRVGHR